MKCSGCREYGSNGVLTDSRVVELWSERVRENGLAADAGDDYIDGSAIVHERLLHCVKVRDATFHDIELVCSD